MWPKEMFEWKRKPLDLREEQLKQLIAQKSTSYVEDFIKAREVSVDSRPESV